MRVSPREPYCEPLAQSVEHLPFKQRVAGSIPARLIRGLANLRVLPSPERADVYRKCVPDRSHFARRSVSETTFRLARSCSVLAVVRRSAARVCSSTRIEYTKTLRVRCPLTAMALSA